MTPALANEGRPPLSVGILLGPGASGEAVIQGAMPDSPSYDLVRRGDVVRAVEGAPVASPEEVIRAVRAITGQTHAQLLLERDGREVAIIARLADLSGPKLRLDMPMSCSRIGGGQEQRRVGFDLWEPREGENPLRLQAGRLAREHGCEVPRQLFWEIEPLLAVAALEGGSFLDRARAASSPPAAAQATAGAAPAPAAGAQAAAPAAAAPGRPAPPTAPPPAREAAARVPSRTIEGCRAQTQVATWNVDVALYDASDIEDLDAHPAGLITLRSLPVETGRLHIVVRVGDADRPVPTLVTFGVRIPSAVQGRPVSGLILLNNRAMIAPVTFADGWARVQVPGGSGPRLFEQLVGATRLELRITTANDRRFTLEHGMGGLDEARAEMLGALDELKRRHGTRVARCPDQRPDQRPG